MTEQPIDDDLDDLDQVYENGQPEAEDKLSDGEKFLLRELFKVQGRLHHLEGWLATAGVGLLEWRRAGDSLRISLPLQGILYGGNDTPHRIEKLDDLLAYIQEPQRQTLAKELRGATQTTKALSRCVLRIENENCRRTLLLRAEIQPVEDGSSMRMIGVLIDITGLGSAAEIDLCAPSICHL